VFLYGTFDKGVFIYTVVFYHHILIGLQNTAFIVSICTWYM